MMLQWDPTQASRYLDRRSSANSPLRIAPREAACVQKAGQSTAAGRSTTRRTSLGFWIEGDSGSQVQNLSRHAGLELVHQRMCGPPAVLDRECNPTRCGRLPRIPWYRGLITLVARGLVLGNCGTCTKSGLGPLGAIRNRTGQDRT